VASRANGLHGVISQKRELIITTGVRTSNPTIENCGYVRVEIVQNLTLHVERFKEYSGVVIRIILMKN
jgi:hypothetical protein